MTDVLRLIGNIGAHGIHALELALGVDGLGVGLGERSLSRHVVGAALLDGGAEELRVDARQELSLFHG